MWSKVGGIVASVLALPRTASATPQSLVRGGHTDSAVVLRGVNAVVPAANRGR
jgi:hypothetical protein